MSITVYDDGISRSVASHIKNPKSNNIKFCGIAFECETIEDCKGNLFVKVVRCKDCKHRDAWGHWLGCPILGEDDDNYCSFAERKDGEEDGR